MSISRSAKRALAILFILLAVMAIINMEKMVSLFFVAEDTTVRLKGCDDSTCELHGTLKVDPISGDYMLHRKDGSEVRFAQQQMVSAFWSAQIDVPDTKE
jgi:hypothetical protein